VSYDIILYKAEPILIDAIAAAWAHIGAVSAYDDYVVVEAANGNLFVHLNNLIDRPDCLNGVDDDELAAIRAITDPIYNFNIQSVVPELLNVGFLSFPATGRIAVDNDNGFVGPLDEALNSARSGTNWLKADK
jgi:hypothetical protein